MIKKTFSRRRGASFPSCFRPTPTATTPTAATSTTTSTTTNLTTSLYHTPIGVFALTWSHTLLSRSLHLHLLPHLPDLPSSSHTLTFHPLLFWSKSGSRPLPLPSGPSATLSWDLSRAKFGPGPEPESNFSVSVHLDSQPLLLVSASKPGPQTQSLVVRREHVQGARLHTTKAHFGGRVRPITIECEHSDPDPKLVIRVDDKKVLQVKHLKWKFRGSDRIDVDGHPITISWDVYNWLFDDCDKGEGFALFTFRFENEIEEEARFGGERVLVTEEVPAERGWRKKKGLVGKAARSSALSSSVSASSASSACGSVLEWESVEETELKGPTGFSLLVYAWKS